MDTNNDTPNFGAITNTMSVILSALEGLDTDARRKTLLAVATILDVPLGGSVSADQPSSHRVAFSENRDMSPKEFLMAKSPKTDVERVACLAYYLTHYANTPYFKTIDISTLNTEAAQPKFSNAAVAVENAAKAGLLVPAVKGSKQMSAAGELFVQALPDRDAAKESIKELRPKRKNKKNLNKKNNTE